MSHDRFFLDRSREQSKKHVKVLLGRVRGEPPRLASAGSVGRQRAVGVLVARAFCQVARRWRDVTGLTATGRASFLSSVIVPRRAPQNRCDLDHRRARRPRQVPEDARKGRTSKITWRRSPPSSAERPRRRQGQRQPDKAASSDENGVTKYPPLRRRAWSSADLAATEDNFAVKTFQGDDLIDKKGNGELEIKDGIARRLISKKSTSRRARLPPSSTRQARRRQRRRWRARQGKWVAAGAVALGAALLQGAAAGRGEGCTYSESVLRKIPTPR